MKTPIKRQMREEVARGGVLVRTALVKRGLRGNTLSEMTARGKLYRVAQGVYVPTDGAQSEWFDYEVAACVVPKGVFTLRSALRIHDLTDENPLQMTMAIPQDAHATKSMLPITFTYMKKELISSDVEVYGSEGRQFRVFSVERTLVECFRARNKIGLQVCLTALDEAISQKKLDWNRLWEVMKRCRMTRVMQPYLEGRMS